MNKYFFTILIPLCIFIKVSPFSMLYIWYFSNQMQTVDHLYKLTRFFVLLCALVLMLLVSVGRQVFSRERCFKY